MARAFPWKHSEDRRSARRDQLPAGIRSSPKRIKRSNFGAGLWSGVEKGFLESPHYSSRRASASDCAEAANSGRCTNDGAINACFFDSSYFHLGGCPGGCPRYDWRRFRCLLSGSESESECPTASGDQQQPIRQPGLHDSRQQHLSVSRAVRLERYEWLEGFLIAPVAGFKADDGRAAMVNVGHLFGRAGSSAGNCMTILLKPSYRARIRRRAGDEPCWFFAVLSSSPTY